MPWQVQAPDLREDLYIQFLNINKKFRDSGCDAADGRDNLSCFIVGGRGECGGFVKNG